MESTPDRVEGERAHGECETPNPRPLWALTIKGGNLGGGAVGREISTPGLVCVSTIPL